MPLDRHRIVSDISPMNRLVFLLIGCSLLLAACASYDGRGLRPGIDGRDSVQATMGAPAMRWPQDDGGELWAYPRGPAGTQTFMVHLGADGKLQRVEKVLDMTHFARIRTGIDDKDSVQRLIGPPNPAWSVYFEARDELAWEWLFCDDWGLMARFGVLFDGSSGKVRSTFQRPELRGVDGSAPACGH